MSYLVYARKYRPKTFEDMIGQNAVVRTLQNSIKNGRVAQAYIFSGMRGIGKTTASRIFAKALNCLEGPTPQPCNRCEFCQEINEDRSMDVIEIDGASNNSVEEVRTLREGVQYKPLHCRYKVIIIDEIHMLSKSAFNALLKTLEEPPENTVFIFATTEFHKVPATIVSRCQHFELKSIPLTEIVRHLKDISEKENLTISQTGLVLLAEAAEGSLRDAQSLLDQAVAFSGSEVSDDDLKEILGTMSRDLLFFCSGAILEERPEDIFVLMEKILAGGHDLRFFHEQLIQHIRNLLVVKTVKAPEDLLPFREDDLVRLKKEADKSTADDLLRYLTALQQAETGLRFSTHPRIFLEGLLVRLSRFRQLVPLMELIEEFKAWKRPENQSLKKPVVSEVKKEPESVKADSHAPSEKLPAPKKIASAPAEKSPLHNRNSNQDDIVNDPSVQNFLDKFKAQILSVEAKADSGEKKKTEEEN